MSIPARAVVRCIRFYQAVRACRPSPCRFWPSCSIYAIEAIERPETISLADFTRSKDVFVLQVRGESMQDEHILDGDYVLVEKTKIAHNGDIVVALVESTDATLKRFYREGDKIRLQPSNARMNPIIVPAADVAIQGRVIGVLRKY